MRYFIKNQPWSTRADSESYLRSSKAIDWNLWSVRQQPYSEIDVGDRVVLARGSQAANFRLDWVVEVTQVLRGGYRNRVQSFDLMQQAFPRHMKAIGATRKNWATNWPYNRSAPASGYLLAFTMKPVQFLDFPRDPQLRIRPNGWLPLTEVQYRDILRTDVTVPDMEEDADQESALNDVRVEEGYLRMRTHLRRERSSALVQTKKLDVLHRTGRLDCEACGFNFLDSYGSAGEGFIECHHLWPLSSTGPTRTRLADLALLCSNCHSVIHRLDRPDDLETLRTLIRSPRSAQ